MKGTGRLFFMTFGYRNMAVARLCLVFLLVLSVDRIAGKPFFGSLMCDWFCDDDDDVSTTTSSSEDDYDWWGCNCRPARTTTPTSFILPPIPGMSYNVTSGRKGLFVIPAPQSQATAASANSPVVAQTTTVTRVSSVATTVPAGATTPPAGASTAAAGATTAPAGATPAAATTAAATTAATTAAPAA